jgi:hypothetical protein
MEKKKESKKRGKQDEKQNTLMRRLVTIKRKEHGI